MAKKPNKQRLPTYHQAEIIRRIAITGSMMLTHEEGHEDRYHDASGRTIAAPTARLLIRNGWLIADRDSMFDLEPQSWRAKTPS